MMSNKLTEEQQQEPLLDATIDRYGKAYTPSTYETVMSTVGNVFGSICCWCAYQSVNRGEVGLITQYGRYLESKDEGLHYVNMMTQKMMCVDTKRTTHALNKQTVLTSDNLQVNEYICESILLQMPLNRFFLINHRMVYLKVQIDGVVFYHVVDPMTVAFRVNNYYSGTS